MRTNPVSRCVFFGGVLWYRFLHCNDSRVDGRDDYRTAFPLDGRKLPVPPDVVWELVRGHVHTTRSGAAVHEFVLAEEAEQAADDAANGAVNPEDGGGSRGGEDEVLDAEGQA